MDYNAIKKAAEAYGPAMTKFLRDMIAIPSESCEEKGVVMRIKQEMESLGYDKVEIDGLGNVIGWMGDGDKIIAIDSHIDTVGIGNINNSGIRQSSQNNNPQCQKNKFLQLRVKKVCHTQIIFHIIFELSIFYPLR